MAIGEQKERRDERADDAADALELLEMGGQHGCRRGNAGGGQDHHGGMADGEEEADTDRALALLHQLAGDVVDGRDVVGVDGVAQAEAIGEQGGAQQDGLMAEYQQRPGPDRQSCR